MNKVMTKDQTSRLARQCAYSFMLFRVVPVMVLGTSAAMIWVN